MGIEAKKGGFSRWRTWEPIGEDQKNSPRTYTFFLDVEVIVGL